MGHFFPKSSREDWQEFPYVQDPRESHSGTASPKDPRRKERLGTSQSGLSKRAVGGRPEETGEAQATVLP